MMKVDKAALHVWMNVLGSVTLFFAAGFCVISFIAAQPRDALIAKGVDLPPDVESAVLNHGNYYPWPTISEHPILFGLSCLILLVAWWGGARAGRELSRWRDR